jgi:hypothetical protein
MPHRPGQLEAYQLWEQSNPRTGNWLSDTKDILLKFLQDLFYGHEKGCFHWEPGGGAYGSDEEESELILTDAGALNTDTVEKRPVIVVSRGPFAYGNTSLDQLLEFDGPTATRTHTDLLSGSFVINCLSRTGLEAEQLAVIVAKAIRIYRRFLQRAGFFYIGHQVQIGAESPPGAILSGESTEDFINVPVSFPVYYQESWTVGQDAALLRSLSMKATYVARQFDGSLLEPDAINPDGTINEASEGVIVQAWTVP